MRISIIARSAAVAGPRVRVLGVAGFGLASSGRDAGVAAREAHFCPVALLSTL